MVRGSFWLVLVGILVGQIIQIPLAGRDVPVLDAVALVTAGLAIWKLVTNRQSRAQILDRPVWRWLAIWLGVLGISWVVGMILHPGLPGESILYWLRLIMYSASALWFFVMVPRASLGWYQAQLFTVWLLFAAVGFLQLIWLPNLELFEPLGWDPHRFRLFATWLDPNFAAALLAIAAGGIALAMITRKDRVGLLHWLGLAMMVVALIWTGSSSGLLAAGAIGVGLFGLVVPKRVWSWLAVIGLAGFGWLIAGGVGLKLLLASSSGVYRLESWTRAIHVWQDYPWFGIGYNLLPYLAGNYNPFGLTIGQGRADTGFDSSLLTIMATSGLVGLAGFIGVIWSAIRAAVIGWRKKQFFSGLAILATVGLAVSSCFINAWLYPPLFWLWLVIIGFSLKEQDD